MVLQNTFYKCNCFQSNLHKILDLPLFFSLLNKMPSRPDIEKLQSIGVEVRWLSMIVHVLGLERDCILAVLLLPYFMACLREMEEEWMRLKLEVLSWRPPQWWQWWHWLSLHYRPQSVTLTQTIHWPWPSLLRGPKIKPKLCHFSTFLLTLLSYNSIIKLPNLITL